MEVCKTSYRYETLGFLNEHLYCFMTSTALQCSNFCVYLPERRKTSPMPLAWSLVAISRLLSKEYDWLRTSIWTAQNANLRWHGCMRCSLQNIFLRRVDMFPGHGPTNFNELACNEIWPDVSGIFWYAIQAYRLHNCTAVCIFECTVQSVRKFSACATY